MSVHGLFSSKIVVWVIKYHFLAICSVPAFVVANRFDFIRSFKRW
jgi:hypothetical protein